MKRSELLEVAFILDEIIQKKNVIRYTYQNRILIVHYDNGKHDTIILRIDLKK